MLRRPARATPRRPWLGPLLFGAIFFLAGVFTIYQGVIGPRRAVRASAGWRATTCTITASQVQERRDSDGDRQFRARVEYRYQVGGRRLTGDRVDLGRAWSDDRAWAATIVGRYRVGADVTCFYDPRKPTQVTLRRDAPTSTLLGLFGLGVALVGLGVALTALRVRRPPDLPPGLTRLTERGASDLFFAGGFAVVFTAAPAMMIMRGPSGVAEVLFTLVLVAIALGLQLWCWHKLLRAIGPRIELGLDGPARLGGRVTIAVALRTRRSIRSVTVRLLGREEATHRVGTDDITDRETFFEATVAEAHAPTTSMRLGGTVEVPADAVPTWAGTSNRIRWVVAIHADIAVWPDVDDEYELEVTAPDEDDHG